MPYTNKKMKKLIIGLGEVLWDVLPEGKKNLEVRLPILLISRNNSGMMPLPSVPLAMTTWAGKLSKH